MDLLRLDNVGRRFEAPATITGGIVQLVEQ